MPCWLSWLYFSTWRFHARWCWEVLSQAICQHNTFLAVTVWRFLCSVHVSLKLCWPIDYITIFNTIYLLVITTSVQYLPTHHALFAIAINTVLKIAIREKEDHVFLLLVVLASVICFPPNVIFQSNFHLLVLDSLTVLECFITLLYPTVSILLKSPRG